MSSIYPDLPEILVTLDGPVAVVTLNRPPQRNAFTNPMKDSLVAAYSRLDLDNRVKVIVMKGASNAGNAFCAGADLSMADFSSASRGHNEAKNLNEHRDGGGQASLAFLRVRKTTICAINGHAVGIGITMTLTQDIRLIWEGAKVGFVFGKRGIVPEAASSFILPRLIGTSRALELMMTGRILPATSPTLSLLFSSTHPTPEATVQAAMAMAHEIATQNSVVSMAITKALVWRPEPTPEQQHLLDSKAIHVTGNGPDSIEGVISFREKRPPNFPATSPEDLPSELYPWWAEHDIKLKGKL